MSIAVSLLRVIPSSWARGLLLLVSFALLLVGAEVFTNGVEWLGHRLGVSESATGSVLAAVGTVLPETMIPVLAIVAAQTGTGSQDAANAVGVGAILGAPFMLATIAMFLVGTSVLYFSGRRKHGDEFRVNTTATRRDVSFFLVGYTLALVAAFVDSIELKIVIAASLVVLYLTYVVRALRGGGPIEEEGLDGLYLGGVIEKNRRPLRGFGFEEEHSTDPHVVVVATQTLGALALVVLGAHLFVTEIEWASHAIMIPPAVVSLLFAPLATELPETFNSVLWISRDKDVLAIGNITGAMAFQGTLPVTLGILFTSWNLTLRWGTAGFLNTLSIVLAIVSGGIIYVLLRSVDGETMSPVPFLVGGAFYLLFIAVVYYQLFVLHLAAVAG